MQNDNKKSKFQAGLLSVLAFMSKLAFANKVAKLAERFKFKMGFSAKRRHIHTYGGPLSHGMNTKGFVGGRSAARRARRFIKNTPAWYARIDKDTANPVIEEFKDKAGRAYSRHANGQIVDALVAAFRERGHSRTSARKLVRSGDYELGAA